MREDVAIAELALPSGRVVLLESPAMELGPRDVGLRDKIDFSAVLEDLKEFAAMLLDVVRAVSPDEAEIELQVGVDAATGQLMALMTKANLSGGIKLRLKWAKGGEVNGGRD